MFKDKTITNELERIVSQLHILPNSIIFRNNRYVVSPENALASLVNILYSECYALKEKYQSGKFTKPEHIGMNDEQFVNMLSSHNHSSERVEHGWRVKHNHGNGYAEIIKAEETRILPVSALQIPAGSHLNPAQSVTVTFPKEDRMRQPSFYYVFSNEHINLAGRITRIYWNISANGAPHLVNSITQKLNRYNIPFLFKCLNHPSLYFRRDAAVLYIEDEMMHIVSLILPEIYEAVKDHLDEDVPLFAYKYKNGIGIAESPRSQESFGMNRMSAIATALFTAGPYEDKIKASANALYAKGINPLTPYLNKGSRILLN